MSLVFGALRLAARSLSPEAKEAMADLGRLFQQSGVNSIPSASVLEAGANVSVASSMGRKSWEQEADRVSGALAQHLTAEWSAFSGADVARITGVFGILAHRHPPLLEAAASHTLRGMMAYPIFALCNVVNAFARTGYHHQPLFREVASFMAAPGQAKQLSYIDISMLLSGYALLALKESALIDACTKRLKEVHKEIDGPNCAQILNSYARLGEADPEIFDFIANSVVQTHPQSFDVANICAILNAFGKVKIRKTKLMHLLASYLEPRVDEMLPQHVSNSVHAFARLDMYSAPLLFKLRERLLVEDLAPYKLTELATLTHSLAKLSAGGNRLYRRLYEELLKRPLDVWDPLSVAQVLDALRRGLARKKPVPIDVRLVAWLLQVFVKDIMKFDVHGLTQSTWCMVEMNTLDVAEQLQVGVLPIAESETPARCLIRLVFERIDEVGRGSPLTLTERRYLQQLVRAYRYANEVDYSLQPPHVKGFCKTIFDTPTTVVAGAARRRPQPPRLKV